MWFQTAEKVQNELAIKARVMSGTISEENNAEIDLEKHYEVSIKVPLLSLFSFEASQRVNTRAFTGISELSDSVEDPIVYITSHGSVYHKSICCSYIKINVHKIGVNEIDTARSRSGAKYRPCEKCAKRFEPDCYYGDLYVSDYGNRYHVDGHCKAIARSAISVRLSQVENLRPCSKCGVK